MCCPRWARCHAPARYALANTLPPSFREPAVLRGTDGGHFLSVLRDSNLKLPQRDAQQRLTHLANEVPSPLAAVRDEPRTSTRACSPTSRRSRAGSGLFDVQSYLTGACRATRHSAACHPQAGRCDRGGGGDERACRRTSFSRPRSGASSWRPRPARRAGPLPQEPGGKIVGARVRPSYSQGGPHDGLLPDAWVLCAHHARRSIVGSRRIKRSHVKIPASANPEHTSPILSGARLCREHAKAFVRRRIWKNCEWGPSVSCRTVRSALSAPGTARLLGFWRGNAYALSPRAETRRKYEMATLAVRDGWPHFHNRAPPDEKAVALNKSRYPPQVRPTSVEGATRERARPNASVSWHFFRRHGQGPRRGHRSSFWSPGHGPGCAWAVCRARWHLSERACASCGYRG